MEKTEIFTQNCLKVQSRWFRFSNQQAASEGISNERKQDMTTTPAFLHDSAPPTDKKTKFQIAVGLKIFKREKTNVEVFSLGQRQVGYCNLETEYQFGHED
ncbi:unnamed protein product [Caenorhabditis nigoni]